MVGSCEPAAHHRLPVHRDRGPANKGRPGQRQAAGGTENQGIKGTEVDRPRAGCERARTPTERTRQGPQDLDEERTGSQRRNGANGERTEAARCSCQRAALRAGDRVESQTQAAAKSRKRFASVTPTLSLRRPEAGTRWQLRVIRVP